MKVVLFCGGLGMRMRPLGAESASPWAAGTGDLPKPMVRVGGRQPLIWHVMKYYAHFGHKDFILCLGYRADTIKEFFLNYNEFMSNNFVLEHGGSTKHLLGGDIQDWRITFVDTGQNACVGERLQAVRPFLEGEEMFLANYSDGLTDLDLPQYIDAFVNTDKTAAFLCVRPPYTNHVVYTEENGAVKSIQPIRAANVWINGGYFVFRRAIFDYMRPGEELVLEPFGRLIEKNQLYAHKYEGYWTCMDTFKEKQELDELCARGKTPWQVWLDPAKQPQ